MVSFKMGSYTTASEQDRKPEALSFTTSSLQLFQPYLLRMETRLVTQSLRLHRTKFTDRAIMKQQYAQREKGINISMIGRTSLKGGAQNKKGMKWQKKQTTQAIIQQKNEQLISANVPEDQMVRIYQNAYDDLSDMVASVYFNQYMENTDLVEKKAIDQEMIQVFRNQIWNEYGQTVAKFIVKQNGLVYLIFNNEERYQHFEQFRE